MAILEQLRPLDVRAVMTAFRDALRDHREAVNRLNVYPVPDGDTGTNMALTAESVVKEFDGADDMATTCRAISHGSLMGARGNSGVILCQLLRGLAEAWRDGDEAGAGDVARALGEAADAAYEAVMHPVEGTMLTVARAAAEGAGRAAEQGGGLLAVLEAAREAAGDALARTPEQLAVLKEAGVVDAGGAGLVLLLDALLHVADGRPLPEPPATPAAAAVPAPSEEHSAGGPRFEVMYLLEAPDEAMPAFKQAWEALGESIVVVGGEGTWNCHIHTDDVGGAVEAALDAGGRPRRIVVADLAGQVEEERWVREAASSAPAAPPGPSADEPRLTTGVVAVAAGAGLERILRSLGVSRVLAGGQSMNPSTAEILEAVEAVPADQVVVLPNNKNIVPVAEQVGALTAKAVRVVPTRAVPEGMAALLDFDADADADANAAAMTEAAGRVVAGEVTRAVRASSSPAGPIAEGSWLGISRSSIEVVASSAVEAATGLLAKLVTGDHELVTVITGDGATGGDTEAIRAWLDGHCPQVAVEVHDGGQPLYPYLLSIE